MTTAVVIDASVWVTRFLASDPQSQACASLIANQVATGQLLIGPAILLPEVCGAISRRTGKPKLAEKAKQLMQDTPGFRLVPVNAPLAKAAAQLASDHGLRGADAVYAAVAEHLKIPLVSLDHEHLTRAARVIVVLKP